MKKLKPGNKLDLQESHKFHKHAKITINDQLMNISKFEEILTQRSI